MSRPCAPRARPAAATGLLLAAAVFLIPAPAARGGNAVETRTLSSREDGFDVEFTFPMPEVRPAEGHSGYQTVTIPELAAVGEEGEPALPRLGRWFAVPPGVESGATISVEVLGEVSWEGIRPLPISREEFLGDDREGPAPWSEVFEEDAAVYGGGIYPPERASIGRGSRLRYVRVQPLTVAPVVWDPGSGTLSAAARIVVHVRFASGRARGDAGALERGVGQDDVPWERLYEDLILNTDRAAGWARAPREARALRDAVEPEGTHVRIGVRASGIRRVAFEDVEVPAWGGAPLASLRLFDRFHDTGDDPDSPVVETEIPIAILDADGSGTWTEGDAFTFYAQNLFDRRPDLPEYIKRYGVMHAYWLTVREGAGNARMEEASSWLGREDLAPVESYPWTQRFTRESDPEYQGVYMKMGAGSSGHVIDLEQDLQGGVASVRARHAYWLGDQPYDAGTNSNRYMARFDLPGFLEAARFTGRWQGIRRPNSDVHRVNIGLQTDPADTNSLRRFPAQIAFRWQDSTRVSFGEADLAAMPFREADNCLVNLLMPTCDGSALDWFEVAYTRSAKFFEGAVTLSTAGRSGPTEFRIASSPAGDDLIGFDITDPLHPLLLAIDGSVQVITGEGGPPRPRFLRLQWDLGRAERQFFVARASDALLPPDEIETVEWPALATPGDEDYVVIAPRTWFATLAPLLEHRESQGHRILSVPIEDIYAEFGGGHRWPHAVRTFLRTLFRTRSVGPSYLLLVGDATDGFDNRIPFSDPDFVPTQTIFSNSYQRREGPELCASDQWFVDGLTGSGETLDFLPDMFVGRLPVDDPGSTDPDKARQLANIVQKLIANEEFQPDESWRNRVLFVSDDAWSCATAGCGDYCFQGSERIFHDSANSGQDAIEDYGRIPGFGIDRFEIACSMDTVGALGRCASGAPDTCRCVQYNACADYSKNRSYGETTVAPNLWAAMSRPHLFISFNGHGNGRLMTHEHVFRHSPRVREDVHHLGNLGCPFLFMGFSCHLAEFSSVDEGNPYRGDAFTESMIHLYPDRGGIAAIASTGYEWLDLTTHSSLAVIDAFFRNPPRIDGRTRWVLGDVFGGSKINVLAMGNDDRHRSMSATYTLLGDPGMVMDADAPRVQVLLNGEPVDAGTPIVLPAGQDSVTFEVRVRDEVGTGGFEVRDAGGVVDPSRYTISQDPDGDRGFTARYTTTILLDTYEIQFSATDANSRVRSVSFPVRTTVEFEWLREGRDWRSLPPGTTIARGDSLRARLDLPIYVAEGHLCFLVDGDSAAARPAPTGLENGTSRMWAMTLLGDLMGAPEHTLAVRIDTPGGGSLVLPETPIEIRTEAIPLPGDFEIEALHCVPNPFTDSAWFFYSVPYVADDVSIRIYTSSGKLIRTLRGLPSPQLADDPPVAWDGKDEDGDDVANGLYFYRMSVTGNGRSVSRIEKLARVR